MFDAGVDSLLDAFLASLRRLVAEADGDGLDRPSALPAAGGQLVEAAGKLPFGGWREECGGVEAAAIVVEADRHRRVNSGRHFGSWVDGNGVARRSRGTPPDEWGRLMAEVDRRC